MALSMTDAGPLSNRSDVQRNAEHVILSGGHSPESKDLHDVVLKGVALSVAKVLTEA